MITPRSLVLALAVLVLPLPALALPDPAIVLDVLRGAPARDPGQPVASWSGPRPEARPAPLAQPVNATFDDRLAMIAATLDCLSAARRGRIC